MVTTFPGFQYQYGYTQVVARIPYGPGPWPAPWMAAANEKWPPEIDILEHWHTFGLYWSPSEVIWYVDGHQVMSATSGVPRQPMYFFADLAVDQQNAAGWKDGASLDI